MTTHDIVTVDTGKDSDLFLGCLLTWVHCPRGGYGYSIPVQAKVCEIRKVPTGWRVGIEVRTKSGSAVKRWVTPDTLRWRAVREASR